MLNFSYLLNYILKYPNVEQSISEITTKDNLKAFSPLIFNRYLSFHSNKDVKNASYILNKYIYTIKDNAIIFELMCNLTPSLDKTYIQYKSKNKIEKRTESIIQAFKKFYGRKYNTAEINEIIDFLYKNLKSELVNVCLNFGLTTKEIIKEFPDINCVFDNLKISSTEKKNLIKILENGCIKKNKKTRKKSLDEDII